MKIVLDPGHGRQGNPYPPQTGYYEGTQMWLLSQLLAVALEKRGFTVQTTRSAITDDPTLAQRGKRAKGADMFLSLHSNAAASPGDTGPTGTATYYSLKGKEYKDLAESLSSAVSGVMGHYSRGAKTKESGTTPGSDYYGVIRNAVSAGCTCAMILEHGFHTNPQDAAFLIKDENLQKLAEAEADLLAEYFGLTKEAEEMIYRTIDDVPAWGKAAIQKLVDKGLLAGVDDKGTLNLTESMLRVFVLHDKTGLYDIYEDWSKA